MYAAKKYIMPHLVQECVKYLETNVDADNACLLLSHSRIFDETELVKRCLEFIDSRTEEVLQSDSFIDIDYQTLEQILGRDTLSAEETVIHAAAARWAEAECTRQGRDTSPQQCREVLGEALYLIRFPAMNLESFAIVAARSKLLSKPEIADLFLYLTTEDKPKLRFPTTRRKQWMQEFESCMRFSYITTAGWNYAGRLDSIDFSADKSIFVVGFGLYGSLESGVSYRVDIKLTRNGNTLRRKEQSVVSDGSTNTAHVFFDTPVQIEANKQYTASLFLKNDKTGHCGIDGKSIVACNKVSFTFTCSPESKNGTDIGHGQIPEILFCRWPHYTTWRVYDTILCIVGTPSDVRAWL